MGIGVKVKVWGDYALFSRPELKVERYSYDVMTPSAARGILEAIYWPVSYTHLDVYKRQGLSFFWMMGVLRNGIRG